MSDRMESTVHPKIRRKGRAVVWILSLLAGGAIMAVVSVVVWNQSASRDWQQLKAEIEADGETFDLQKLLPVSPEAAENFCAIPALDNIAKFVPGKPVLEDDATWQKRFAPLNEGSPGTGDLKRLFAGVKSGRGVDLNAWAEFFRKGDVLKMPPQSGQPAKDILSAIDQRYPMASELVAALGKTESQFTPGLRQRTWAKLLMAQPVPHLNLIQNAATVMRLRAAAAIHAGDGIAGLECTLAILRLSDAASQEPFLLGHLVSTTIRSMALAVVWEGLMKRTFSETQLQRLHKELSNFNVEAQLLYAVRTEMIATVNAAEHFRIAPSEVSGLGKKGNSFRYLPKGWSDHNARVIASLLWADHIKPLKEDGLIEALREARKADKTVEELGENWLSRMVNLVVVLAIPSLGPLYGISGATQSINDQALAAIGVERFFLQHKQYPRSLEDLVPDLMPSVPSDRLTRLPLRYRLSDDGRYAIWSVGFDGVDDDGRVTLVRKSGGATKSIYRYDYKGDWTWQYSPVEPDA